MFDSDVEDEGGKIFGTSFYADSPINRSTFQNYSFEGMLPMSVWSVYYLNNLEISLNPFVITPRCCEGD
jgi:hypothetical protein